MARLRAGVPFLTAGLLAVFFSGCETRVELAPRPVALAGNDQVVQSGSLIVLDGSESHVPGPSSGAPEAFRWSVASAPAGSSEQPSVTIEHPDGARTVALVNEPGLYVFRLDVFHGGVRGEPAYTNVTALRIPIPPVAVTGEDIEVEPGTFVRLDGSESHAPDGGALRYLWRQIDGPEVELSDADGPRPGFIAPRPAGSLVFGLTVIDVRDIESAEDTVEVRVLDLDPVAVIDAPSSARELEEVTLDGSGSFDPNGRELGYSWVYLGDRPDVELSGGDGPTTGFIAPRISEPTQLVFQLVVDDGHGRSGSSTATVMIERDIVGLVVTEQPPPVIGVEETFAVAVEVLDVDGRRALGADDLIILSLEGGQGAGLMGEIQKNAEEGLAVFDDLWVDEVGDGMSILISSPRLLETMTAPFDVVSTDATHLVITAHPSGQVAGLPFPVIAEVRDQDDEISRRYDQPVTIEIATGTQGATLSGQIVTEPEMGVATFAGLSIDLAGAYTLRVRSEGLVPDETGPIAIVAASPVQLAFATDPRVVQAGDCSEVVVVERRDEYGNPAGPLEGVTIDFSTDMAGVEFFSGSGCAPGQEVTSSYLAPLETSVDLWFRATTVGSPELTASTTGLAEAKQTQTVMAGDGARLVIDTQPPSTLTAGSSFGVIARVEDAEGNLATSFDEMVSISLADPGSGGELTGVLEVEAAAGEVAFSGLRLTRTGTFALRVEAAGVSHAVTSPIEVAPAGPAALAILTGPHQVDRGSCSPAVVFEVQDQYGNPTAIVTPVQIQLGSSSVTTEFRPDAACSEEPISSIDLDVGDTGAELHFLDWTQGTLTLTVDGPGLAPAVQDHTILHLPTAAVVFETEGHTVHAGQCSPQLILESRDEYGEPTPAPQDIHIALSFDTGALEFFAGDCLAGSSVTSVSIQQGQAQTAFRFQGTTVGSPTITAGPTGFDPVSQLQTIVAAAATSLVFHSQPPASGVCDQAFSTVVHAVDDYGNHDTAFTGAVQMELAPSPLPDTGELSGTLLVTASSGVASFDDLAIDEAGDYRLRASSQGVAAAISEIITVVVVPTRVVVTVGPPNPQPLGSPFGVTAEIRDEAGRVDTTYAGPVSISLVEPPSPPEATLHGPKSATASGGQVSFSDLWIDRIGPDFVLELTDDAGVLTPGQTASFSVQRFEFGSGVDGDPYRIANVYQLQQVAAFPAGFFSLLGDIDASETNGWSGGHGFLPIGSDAEPFTGIFNGGFFSVEGLHISRTSTNDVGLFGVVGANGRVRNLCLFDVSVTGDTNVGAIAGRVENEGRVVRACSTGQVNATYRRAGGLVGVNDGVVRDSYSRAAASAADWGAGGLVGRNGLDSSGRIVFCYSSGAVSASGYAGGLVGYASGSVTEDSFWDTQTSGQATSDGGTGKTTAEMKNVRTYTDVAWSAGLTSSWDFVGDPYDDTGTNDFWEIDQGIEDGYPHLDQIWSD